MPSSGRRHLVVFNHYELHVRLACVISSAQQSLKSIAITSQGFPVTQCRPQNAVKEKSV